PDAKLIGLVEDHSLLRRIDTATSGSHWGSGGMRSKVVAAEMASTGGVVTYIARASEPGIVGRVAAGEHIGTRIAAALGRRGSSFKLWLRYAKRAAGTILVDAGARAAIVERGASLLPVGVTGSIGTFHAGDAVEVRCAENDEPFAKGIVEYSHGDLERLAGDHDAARGIHEAIHRDRLVLLATSTAAN
ncbi:MAG: PUA domain-containing protein, partial [Gaiellales bacterium]